MLPIFRVMPGTGKSIVVVITLLGLLGPSTAQQAGYLDNEEGPMITLKECTLAGGCISKQKKTTIDANWRWIHKVGGYENCYAGSSWDKSICDRDGAACAQNCVVEGVTKDKYSSTYGISEIPNGVKLKFVTEHEYGVNVGGRLYVLDDDNRYYMFQLKNREFALDIDVSNLFCGMNGAMYFVEMDNDGGKGLGRNQAGAKYGTGYCDAQCPHDIKFIDGEANCVDWVSNPLDLSDNMGIGKYGSCCAEMDIWEANSMATAYTPHTCDLGNPDQKPAQFRCEGSDCGDNSKGERYQGVCDKDGCDINPFRMGNQTFYGRGPEYTINTLKPMTVVTQFITSDGTDTGDLVEIRRFYKQEGRIIHSPPTPILGANATDSITDKFCHDKKELFEDVNDFQRKGGNKAMGQSLDRGHVLALSLWDDVEVNMLWLDSAYPLDKPRSKPGVLRGDCPGGQTSTPTYLRDTYPDGYVTFANAAIGEIGSTLLDGSPAPSPGGGGSCGVGACQGPAECRDKNEAPCRQMAREGKCTWIPPVPCTTTSAPTPTPTPAPTEPTCELDRDMRACVAQGRSFKCERCTNDISGEPCCACHEAENPVTTNPPPEPEPEPEPSTPVVTEPPMTTTPLNDGCMAYCNKVNLRASGLWCNARKNNESGCLNSYLLTPGSTMVTPCKFQNDGKCKSDKDNKRECENLQAQCESTPTFPPTLAPTPAPTLAPTPAPTLTPPDSPLLPPDCARFCDLNNLRPTRWCSINNGKQQDCLKSYVRNSETVPITPCKYVNNKCKMDSSTKVEGCPDLTSACPKSFVQMQKHVFQDVSNFKSDDDERTPELRTVLPKSTPRLRTSRSTYGQALIQRSSQCVAREGLFEDDYENLVDDE